MRINVLMNAATSACTKASRDPLPSLMARRRAAQADLTTLWRLGPNLSTFGASSNRVAPLSNVQSWKPITTKDASLGCEGRCAIQASFLSQLRPERLPKQARTVDGFLPDTSLMNNLIHLSARLDDEETAVVAKQNPADHDVHNEFHGQ